MWYSRSESRCTAAPNDSKYACFIASSADTRHFTLYYNNQWLTSHCTTTTNDWLHIVLQQPVIQWLTSHCITTNNSMLYSTLCYNESPNDWLPITDIRKCSVWSTLVKATVINIEHHFNSVSCSIEKRAEMKQPRRWPPLESVVPWALPVRTLRVDSNLPHPTCKQQHGHFESV